MNVNSMLKQIIFNFNWLNLAVGHSAKKMTSPNNTTNDGRFRQFFLSFDIDLMRIKTENKVLSTLSNVFGYIKIPFPTLELSNKNSKFHPLYF